jgi:hypothetical protein
VTFLHPLVLLGLAAAAIPALLHLLERRVPPEAEFPPLRYLTEAERQSARRLKLRHLLLLVLRTMLIAVIVLAAARPLLPSKRGGGLVHEPTVLAVILDNSPSSSVVIDGHPVLDRLKATARASLARATAVDRLWLVLADGVARGGTREALLATVDSVGVSPYRLDLTAAVRAATRLVDAEPLRAREVHVVSDLQLSALGPGRAAVPRGVRVLALAPLDHAPENRGVGAIQVTEAAVVVGVVGTPGAGAAPMTVRIQGREIGRGLAAPGSAATIPLPAFGAGWWVGEATLDPDELRADDRRLFVWHVAPPAQVEAQPSAGPFVAAALAVLEEGRKIRRGSNVTIGDRPAAGSNTSVVMPPTDAALIGEVNRALAGRGGRWRFGPLGTPGPITGTIAPEGTLVSRRYRLEETRAEAEGMVLARVNGEPWLVRDGSVVLIGSRLDTAWTALPATPGFVPFVDALVNRLVRGEGEEGGALVTEAEGPPRVDFRTRGADTLGATVLGPDPRESDLTPAPRGLVRDVLGGRAEVLDDGAFAAARFAGTGRSDVSGLLLMLALLLALVELGVATLTR